MQNRIKLDDIPIQEDGVRSSQPIDDIHGFVASDLYPEFKKIDDFSALNTDFIHANDSFAYQLNFSPQRANFLRAFDWDSGMDVLEIGCASGAVTYFLAEQNLSVDAIETNRQLAQLAYLRTCQFSAVSVISESFNSLDFGNKKYSAIILNGATDFAKSLISNDSQSYKNTVCDLLMLCNNLLEPQGRIFLAADNRQGLKYIYGATDERIHKSYYGFNGYKDQDRRQTLNLVEWRSLVAKLSFKQIEEYYLFPDFRFTSVLLGKEYSLSNQNAFQHLEGIHSKDYFQYQASGNNEILLYQAANAHGHLGDFANSCMFVLGADISSEREKLDFAHLPSFKRKSGFISLVKKYNGEDIIRREKLFEKVPKNNQQLVAEPYHAGRQLSVIWRNSIISDHRGIEFQQCLLTYLDYLKKLDSGVFEGMNIDAIPNNIIIDVDEQWQLIDREWLTYNQEGIDAVFVFYRAVVHFALRNETIFYYFNWLAGISTLGDFIYYCFRVVGLNTTSDELEEFRIHDMNFLSYTMLSSQGYHLSDEFGGSSVGNEIYPSISWSYDGQSYLPEQRSVRNAKADNKSQKLTFRVPSTQQLLTSIRFHPFVHLQSSDAGYFGVSSLQVRAINELHSNRIILNLESSDQVNKANTHDAVFYSQKDSDHVFMFTSHHTFLEFKLPGYQLNDNDQLQIEINFRLSPSHDYEIARHKFGLVERKMVESLRLKDEQLKVLEKKFNTQNQELEEMQASRIWRLLAAYRDTFKISGYPEKNYFGKLRLLMKRFKYPKKDEKD